MNFKVLSIIVISFSLIILSQLIVPSELAYPLITLPSSTIDFPSFNLTVTVDNQVIPVSTVKPYWHISLGGSGEFIYDVLGYCVIYFYNGSTGIFPYNAFDIPFLSHMKPNQIKKAYYWTYRYPGAGSIGWVTINNITYPYNVEVPQQTLIVCYYITTLSEQELKNVMLETFKNVNSTTFNSEKIYYVYTNNGTCAEFVDVIGSHIIVVINYSSNNSKYDLLSYYENPILILLELTYKVNNYMENATRITSLFPTPQLTA